MQFENNFPFGLAKASAFIGREEELAWLQRNINTGIHSLLMAPRRYGKSSLALNTLEKSKTPYIEIDLHLCRSSKSVEKKIISGIERLITNLVEEKEEILKHAKSFFKKANKHWRIGLKGFVELEIEPDKYDDTAENILTTLQFLDSILQTEKKRVVIFLDEFQEVTELEESREIQGAIRHFAQKTDHVIFIFSGSNRRLLRTMFENNTMPLYQLCDIQTLHRIPAEIYKKYISKVAKKTWGEAIQPSVIDEILKITQRHPRRTYNLCYYIWRTADIKGSIPNIDDVNKAWDKLLNSEKRGIRFYLSSKSTGQLKVLTYIAQGNRKALTSKLAQRITDLSATAISKAVQLLEEDDLIERDEEGGYRVIDPVIKSVLYKFESELLE